MLFKKNKEVIIEGYGRSKVQEGVRSTKEMEHGLDISEVNISNCIFYGRFEGEKMSA